MARHVPPQELPWSVFLEPLFFASGVLFAGFAYRFGSWPVVNLILAIFLFGGIGLLGWRILREALHGRMGVDVIAVSAMVASAILGQWVTGTVILIMLSGGEALEEYATRRARRHLTSLFSRTPMIAHRKEGGGLRDVSVNIVAMTDVLVVKPGEVVPLDGVITKGATSIDESLLTGEPLAVDKGPHDRVLAGSLNQDGLFEMRATSRSVDSQYQRMVVLVHEAEAHKALFVRLADRYSFVFTLITAAMALMAWLLSKNPVNALAVLVVATPCPLILATPIAFLSGISRAAKQGIITRSGGALEVLAQAKAFVFDKTGTLTFGAPSIVRVVPFGIAEQDAIRLAASLDQCSSHVLARVIVTYAKSIGVSLSFPVSFQEVIGKGVVGVIDGTKYVFGRATFLREHGCPVSAEMLQENEASKSQGLRTVYLGTDHYVLAEIVFADAIRPGLKPFFQSLAAAGIQKTMMLTGDKRAVAKRIAEHVGISSIHAECLPEDKVREIKNLQGKHLSVVMVGDGVNDAPALASADVGIAMGANGSGAASESADIVITVDDVTRVGDALRIAQRTLHVAKTGIVIGMGLSFILMTAAMFGQLPPVYGAVLQEMIDVIVILQALR